MTLVEEPQPGTGYSYNRGFEEVKLLKNNPGPGQYQVTFTNQKSQPKFSLNKTVLSTDEQERRAKQTSNQSGVGPGSYNTDQSSLNARGIQIGQRFQTQNKNENPGPASYNINRDHNSQPHLSFAQATRENLNKKDSVPASNQYQPNVTEMKRSNKGYIMMKSYKEDTKPKIDERPLYDLTKKKSNTAYRIAKPYSEENKKQKQEDKGADMINLRDVYDRMKSNTAGSFGPKGGPLLLKRVAK